MCKIIVFFVLCVLSFHLRKAEESKCLHEHEEYICGTKCPKTCTNLDIANKCLSGCNEGCFCKEGYVRNEEKGNCVKPTECPTCGRNETYKARGFNCQTCSNHQLAQCALLNEYLCYCYPGYVRRNEDHICIAPENCPGGLRYRRNASQIQCNKPNEEYSACQPGPCERTCQHTEKDIACAAVCIPHGCRCKHGFLRDAITKECVPEENCP